VALGKNFILSVHIQKRNIVQITIGSRVLLGKLVVSHLIKAFLAFYGT
jgi:hypothetical protein